WRGSDFDPRQWRWCIASEQAGVHRVVDIHRGVDGGAGLVRVVDGAVDRVVLVGVVHRAVDRGVDRAVDGGVVDRIALDRGLVSADGGRVVVDDDDAASGTACTTGRVAAVVADADEAAATISSGRTATAAAAHVDVVDDRSLVVGDDVAARGLVAAVVDVVVLTDVDVGVVDIAGVDVLVVVTDHVAVAVHVGRVDIARGSGVDHTTVGGSVRRL